MADLFSVASGAARVLWLAELSQALDEAHDLTCRMGHGTLDLELMEIHIRIEAARHELRALRLGSPDPALSYRRSPSRQEDHPFWTGSSPWQHKRSADQTP